MEFRQIDSKDFEELAKKHPQFSFHQTPGWAKLKKTVGWKHYYVGVFDEKEPLGLALLLAKPVPHLNKYIFYSPRGPLVDYENKDVLSFFTNELKNFIKKNNGIFLKVDPYVTYKQRDKDGNLVEGGFDHSVYVDNLKSLGYKHKGFNIYFDNLQPRFISVLDTKDKTMEEIEANYMSTLRKELRQNTRNGIYTREMTYDELPEFIRLANSTGERKGYNTRPLEYYQEMWKDLYDDGYMKMAITFMNFKKAKEVTQSLIDEILENRKVNEEKAKAGLIKVNEKKALVKQKEEDTAIANYQKNIENFNELEKKYGEEIAVSSLLWLMSDKDMICMLIGNDEDFMKYKTSFSCYNWGIKYAVDHHIDRYNFYGITGDFSKDNPDYGLFEMKQRFGACVEELIGEFDLVVSPIWYKLFKIAAKLKG